MKCFQCVGIVVNNFGQPPREWVNYPQCHKHWAEAKLEDQVGRAMMKLKGLSYGRLEELSGKS